MPQLVVHFHLDQHIAGIQHALAGDFLAGAQFHNFFGGDQDLADLRRESECFGAAAQ
jgi:hypothetical protein